MGGWTRTVGGVGTGLALAFCFVPAIAGAQVLEIGAGGQVRTYDRPAVFEDEGVKPIETPQVATARPGRRHRETPEPEPGPPPAPGAALTQAAVSAELSPALISAVAWQESRYRARVLSRAGAVGEMQLMPRTAKALGVDPYDSGQNYHGGAAYLRALMQRYDGDLVRTLAAYDAGPGAVDRYGGVPPYRETRAYVSAVLDRLSASVIAPDEKGTR